jgi:hypothetical protein
MNESRSFNIFQLLAALSWIASSCSSGNSSGGVSTIGNPRLATSLLLASICDTVARCNPQAQKETCQADLLSQSINFQVGAPSAYSDFSSVMEAELSGKLTVNDAALGVCTSTIQSLDCTDPLVLASYNSSLSNPFSGTTNVFPLNGSCTSVFSAANVEPSANYRYVRAGATGNGDGSDWTHACPDLTGVCAGSALVRGATYYVASGNYSAVSFSVPGTQAITLKKASLTDHGTDTGWSSSYASGPASFPHWSFSSGNWILDGNGRTNPTSGHGFKLDLPGLNSGCSSSFCTAIWLDGTRDIDNIKFRYTEILGFGALVSRPLDGIYSATSTGSASNISFSYGYVHEFGSPGRAMVAAGGGIRSWMFENSVVARIRGMALDDQGSSNITIRNNFFEDIDATAVIVSENAGASATTANMAIYGNIFWENNPSTYGTSNGVIACINGNICTNWRISNNTIAGFTGPASLSGRIDFGSSSSQSTGNISVNNLWYNSANIGTTGTWTQQDYNAYFSSSGAPSEPHGQVESTNPFINSAAGDFRLTSPALAGLSLPAPYDSGILGAFANGSGLWSRGAY